MDCRLLAQVLQTGSGRVSDRRDPSGVRDRPGERPRSPADRAAARGHLRRGLHAGAQLRAELFEDVHQRRQFADPDQRNEGRQGGAPVDLLHGPAVGHGSAISTSGGHKVFRLQVSPVLRPYRVRNVLQRRQMRGRVSYAVHTFESV